MPEEERDFVSHALWPKGVHDFCDNHTTDDHHTEGEADGVCRLMNREGQVQDDGTRAFPLRTWVTRKSVLKEARDIMDSIEDRMGRLRKC